MLFRSKYDCKDLSFVCHSPYYGGAIYAVVADTEFVYAGGYQAHGSPPPAVRKYRQDNLALIGSAPNYGGTIHALTGGLDPDYVYAGGTGARVIRKYQKSDLSLVASSSNLGRDIEALDEDDEFLYVGCFGNNDYVRKFSKSNLAQVGTFPIYGKRVYAIRNDVDYVYAGGGSTYRVMKYRKSNYTLVAMSIPYGYTIYSLTAQDENYVYAWGNANGTQNITPKKYAKSNLAFIVKGPPNQIGRAHV